MRVGSFNGYEVYVGDSPYRDMLDFARQYAPNLTQGGTITPTSMPSSVGEERDGIRQQDMRMASAIFEKNRIPVRGGLRALVGYVFGRFNLPQSDGMDIGSGATGEMVEELLPRTIDRSSWVQMELNPGAVVENRRRHSSSTIVEGSYLDMGLRDSLQIVTGLSSLDATCFLDEAIRQVCNALVVGGYLVHVQDVRPGIGYGLREMEFMGMRPPYPVEFVDKTTPWTYRIGGEYVNVGEIFRRQLGRVLQAHGGMEILMNQWVTVRKPLSATDISRWYFLNVLLRTPCFPMESGPMEDVSAVVTVARKKSS